MRGQRPPERLVAEEGGFSFLIYTMPLSWQKQLGHLVGLIWFDVIRIRRKTAIENLAIGYPTMSERERTQLARQSLKHMGRTIVEFANFPFYDKSKTDRFFVFRGLDHLEAAYAKKKGVLGLTLHMANGDFAIAATSQLGYPTTLIGKVIKNSWINEPLVDLRTMHGTKLISPEKSSFEILRSLKRGEMILFVLDQFMGPPVGVKTTFFGKETGTALGLALMALHTKAPVIPIHTYRQDDGRTVAVFGEEIPTPEIPEGADQKRRDEITASLTQLYTDKLEEIVRQHPEQWMWIHRRWKVFR